MWSVLSVQLIYFIPWVWAHLDVQVFPIVSLYVGLGDYIYYVGRSAVTLIAHSHFADCNGCVGDTT